METDKPKVAEWRCTKCGLPCEAYESRSRYFGRTPLSWCCKAAVTPLAVEGRP